MTTTTCTYCGQAGHRASSCPTRARADAHALLDRARAGAPIPLEAITDALYVTGDIDDRPVRAVVPAGEWKPLPAGLAPAHPWDALGVGVGGDGVILVSIRTGRGLNGREHHLARARRVKAERHAVSWMLPPQRPALPVVVTMTRVSPGTVPMDDDNLSGALKAVRDAVATWLGIDDRDPRVRWAYEQRRGPWAVEVRWEVTC